MIICHFQFDQHQQAWLDCFNLRKWFHLAIVRPSLSQSCFETSPVAYYSYYGTCFRFVFNCHRRRVPRDSAASLLDLSTYIQLSAHLTFLFPPLNCHSSGSIRCHYPYNWLDWEGIPGNWTSPFQLSSLQSVNSLMIPLWLGCRTHDSASPPSCLWSLGAHLYHSCHSTPISSRDRHWCIHRFFIYF